MLRDWTILSDDAEAALAQAALRRATETIAGQAEVLAGEMESGTIADRGGPEALRLLAAVVRLRGGDGQGPPPGHA